MFCVGILARTYMNLTINKGQLWGGRRGVTELAYARLIKERHAPTWPLIVTVVCVPIGIAVMFAAIAWNNHLKVR